MRICTNSRPTICPIHANHFHGSHKAKRHHLKSFFDKIAAFFKKFHGKKEKLQKKVHVTKNQKSHAHKLKHPPGHHVKHHHGHHSHAHHVKKPLHTPANPAPATSSKGQHDLKNNKAQKTHHKSIHHPYHSKKQPMLKEGHQPIAPHQSPAQANPTNVQANPVAKTIPVKIIDNKVNLSKLEKEVFDKVNTYRVSQGLIPLEPSKMMSSVAKKHSDDMAQYKVPFSHQGAEGRFEKIGKAIGATSQAENLAYNMGMKNPSDAAVNGWIKSPGHHANMIGDYNKTGIAVSQNSDGHIYFTQLFAKV